MIHPCANLIFWWETCHHTTCRLSAGHPGDHFDGLYYWDRYGIRSPNTRDEHESGGRGGRAGMRRIAA